MKSYRTDIERLTPSLRQYARALVESYRVDVADELVHDVLAEAMRWEPGRVAEDLQDRLYARLIASNRRRLQTEIGERRTLPGRSMGGEAKPARPGFALGEHPVDDAACGLGSLSLADREALLLVVLAKMDYARAAEVLGIPASTMITRLTHAREHLGTSLWASDPLRAGAGFATPAGAGPARHLRLVKS